MWNDRKDTVEDTNNDETDENKSFNREEEALINMTVDASINNEVLFVPISISHSIY